jgi:hypothetical protein
MIFHYTGKTATCRRKQGYDGNLPRQICRRQAALEILFRLGHFNNPRFYVFPYVFTVPSITYMTDTISPKQTSIQKLASLDVNFTVHFSIETRRRTNLDSLN